MNNFNVGDIKPIFQNVIDLFEEEAEICLASDHNCGPTKAAVYYNCAAKIRNFISCQKDKYPEVFYTDIDDLFYSHEHVNGSDVILVRTLKENNVKKVGDLIQLGYRDFRSMKGIGAKSIAKIMSAKKELGFSSYGIDLPYWD